MEILSWLPQKASQQRSKRLLPRPKLQKSRGWGHFKQSWWKWSSASWISTAAHSQNKGEGVEMGSFGELHSNRTAVGRADCCRTWVVSPNSLTSGFDEFRFQAYKKDLFLPVALPQIYTYRGDTQYWRGETEIPGSVPFFCPDWCDLVSADVCSLTVPTIKWD